MCVDEKGVRKDALWVAKGRKDVKEAPNSRKISCDCLLSACYRLGAIVEIVNLFAFRSKIIEGGIFRRADQSCNGPAAEGGHI